MKLSVVIPAYNEALRIEPSLQRVWDYLRAYHGEGRFEIIVVDDGSSDGTATTVEEFRTHAAEVRLIRLPHNRGKGAAVRVGVLESRGEAVLFSDADLSTPIEGGGGAWEFRGGGGVFLVCPAPPPEEKVCAASDPPARVDGEALQSTVTGLPGHTVSRYTVRVQTVSPRRSACSLLTNLYRR